MTSSNYAIETELQHLHEKLIDLKASTTQMLIALQATVERLEILQKKLLALKKLLETTQASSFQVLSSSTISSPTIDYVTNPLLPSYVKKEKAKADDKGDSDENLGSLLSNLNIDPSENMSLSAISDFVKVLEQQVAFLEEVLMTPLDEKQAQLSINYIKQNPKLFAAYAKKLTTLTLAIENYKDKQVNLEKLNPEFKTVNEDSIHLLRYLEWTCQSFLYETINNPKYAKVKLLLSLKNYLCPIFSYASVRDKLSEAEAICRENNPGAKEEILKSIARVLIIKLLQERICAYSSQVLIKRKEERENIKSGKLPKGIVTDEKET